KPVEAVRLGGRADKPTHPEPAIPPCQAMARKPAQPPAPAARAPPTTPGDRQVQPYWPASVQAPSAGWTKYWQPQPEIAPPTDRQATWRAAERHSLLHCSGWIAQPARQYPPPRYRRRPATGLQSPEYPNRSHNPARIRHPRYCAPATAGKGVSYGNYLYRRASQDRALYTPCCQPARLDLRSSVRRDCTAVRAVRSRYAVRSG